VARREKCGSGDGHVRLIDEMLKMTQDRLTIRFQAHNVFTPAHDGAAVTLSNAFFHLSRSPQEWTKLRAEILPTKGSAITYDLLKTYRYLKNTIRETHRVTPINTFIARQCIQEVVLPSGGGKDGTEPLYLKEGDVVEMNIRSTLRDKDFWGMDADQFRPGRRDVLKPQWEYTPFGGGPRICPGF
jgi:cytochrome P450